MSGGPVSCTASSPPSTAWTNCCWRFKVCANLAIMCPLLYGTETISPEIALRQFTRTVVILLFCNLFGMQGGKLRFAELLLCLLSASRACNGYSYMCWKCVVSWIRVHRERGLSSLNAKDVINIFLLQWEPVPPPSFGGACCFNFMFRMSYPERFGICCALFFAAHLT